VLRQRYARCVRSKMPCCHALSEEPIIAKARFQPRPREPEKRLRVNEFIRTPMIFLVDEDNERVGEVPTDEAKRRAKEVGLDLVEVAPQATPPVCRIMDYGKWKYQQRKKEQKAKSHSKQSELKEVRLRPKIDIHDLTIKMDKAREFLEEGHKVQFTMLFRGREMAHQDIGMRSMNGIVDTLADVSKVESPPKMMGKRMTMMLSAEKKSKSQLQGQANKKLEAASAASAASAPAPTPAPAPPAPSAPPAAAATPTTTS